MNGVSVPCCKGRCNVRVATKSQLEPTTHAKAYNYWLCKSFSCTGLIIRTRFLQLRELTNYTSCFVEIVDADC